MCIIVGGRYAKVLGMKCIDFCNLFCNKSQKFGGHLKTYIRNNYHSVKYWL